jgi:predicted MFS family arabinose efflux permease
MLAPIEQHSPPVSATRWLRGLRHRPLVWLAPAAGLGGTCGLMLGARLANEGVVRGNTLLLWPLLPVLCFLMLSLHWRRSALWSRVAFFLTVTCFSALYSTHLQARFCRHVSNCKVS